MPGNPQHEDAVADDAGRQVELRTEAEAREQARVGQTVRGGGTGAPAPADHRRRDADTETPHAVTAKPTAETPDQLHPHVAEAEDRQEALVDEGLEETFPASDPVSAKRIT